MLDIIWKGNIYTNYSDRKNKAGKVFIPFVIVNHISAGTMSSMDSWFTSKGNTVSSAHFGIARNGKIHQYVDIRKMAWANGSSPEYYPLNTAKAVLDMNTNCNYYSVSIEHEGYDGELTEEQFKSSVLLHFYIRDEIVKIYGEDAWFPLDNYHVIGHFQIHKGKPNCPGPKFPWNRLYEALKQNNKEDEDNMAINAPDWVWQQMYNIIGKAYNEDKVSWEWCQKILDRTMTSWEYSHILAVINAREKGIDIDAVNDAGISPDKRG